jgi:predicted nuclease of predicted toxin-antitoxin system
VSLLFDQNLSRRLPVLLAQDHPGSEHVITSGLSGADDLTIRTYAETKQLTIISKDSDFKELVKTLGAPPKVIRLRIGNCRTKDVVTLIRAEAQVIADFLNDPTAGLLELP